MEPTTVGVPTRCPACQSQDLITASKKIDVDTYWRCRKCGEVWNVERLRTGSGGQWQRFAR